MDSFIKQVAAIYFEHFDTDISRYTFVFPNKRAGVFFQKHLSEIASKPIFSPEILTIDECFFQASELKQADRLDLIFRLYKIYISLSGSQESFDNFVFWSEILLSDFNEADKYLVDIKQLFQNITDLKEIDDSSDYFTENQLEAIRHFWTGFNLNKSESRDKFLQIWDVLLPLYQNLQAELLSEGIGYDGLIIRDVCEKLKDFSSYKWFENRHFVFVGFNALNPSEHALMKFLLNSERADFYWDYESDFLRDSKNPASKYYKQNTSEFPSKYKIEVKANSFENIRIENITVSSVTGQTQHIFRLLQQLYPQDKPVSNFLNTAVILPDEQLLVPVLQSIPENIGKINVTMGYPLSMTPIAGLINLIFDLHKKKKERNGVGLFYHRNVSAILNHQLILLLDEKSSSGLLQDMNRNNKIYLNPKELQSSSLLKKIFSSELHTSDFCTYLQEILIELDNRLRRISEQIGGFELESSFLYQYYVTINRINDIIKQYSELIPVSKETLFRMIGSLTSGIRVPFVGEPLNGLQIMGVLEARGLDFENLIIPSFNEGIIPAVSVSNSFIPYHLRKGFGLPTFEHHDSVVSYNFYRLINRAKHVLTLSDARPDTGKSGEPSRFLHQLKYHYNLPVSESKPVFGLTQSKTEAITILKDESVMKKLTSFLSESDNPRYFSASSINQYLNCSLRFYFEVVEKVEQSTDITEMVESDVFGNIFHQVIARLYKRFEGKTIESDDLKRLLEDENELNLQINKAFSHYFFKDKNERTVEIEGNNLLISRIIRKYVRKVIKLDLYITPFKYIKGEMPVKDTFNTRFGSVNLSGFIDRVDEIDGSARIIDYKTGKGDLHFKSFNDVFNHELKLKDRPSFVLQTSLYSMLYQKKANPDKITPGIYYLKDVFNDDFGILLHDKAHNNFVTNYHDYDIEFQNGLKLVLEDILNPDIPFSQTIQSENCQYCDFKSICRRE